MNEFRMAGTNGAISSMDDAHIVIEKISHRLLDVPLR